MTAMRRWRKRTADILFSADKDDLWTRRVDITLIILITLNVIAVILESITAFHQAWYSLFNAFDAFSVGIFTIEYLARLWSAVDNPWKPDRGRAGNDRLHYMATPMAIIDLLAIAPFYLSVFIDLDLRFLRVLRLLRIFKLTRYSSAMTMLLQVCREEMRTFGAALFVVFLMIVVSSSLIYLVEHHLQPDKFGSIPQAMYWAVITMTSVGYGDVVPQTGLGQLLGSLLAILGVGMVALPAGILASGFTNALHRRTTQMTEHIEGMLADGVITGEEEAELAELAERLNMSEGAVKAVLYTVQGRMKKRLPQTCPHCHKPLTGESGPNVTPGGYPHAHN